MGQKVEEERTSERTELYFVFYCFSSSLLFISGTGHFVVKEQGAERERERMAWSNFLVTAAVIGGLFYMTKADVRQGASMFRRNVKTIRSWIEQGEESVKKNIKEIPGKTKPK